VTQSHGSSAQEWALTAGPPSKQEGRHCHEGSVFLFVCRSYTRERKKIEKIRVLLVCDNGTCLKKLADFLKAQPDFRVMVALNREEARLMAEHHQDLILLNVSLTPPLYAGLDLAVALLESRSTKMILLTSLKEREAIIDAFTIGVVNVVDKSNYRDIPVAIREAHHNRASIHPDAAGLLREEVSRLRKLELQCLLTPAEKQILDLLLQGCTKKQIAEALNITMNTVKFHLRSLIQKIGGRTGKEAAEIAKRRGYK